jgi:hypothetical protein
MQWLFMGALCVAAVALFVALLRLPKWFARSLGRHRLWRLRDVIVHDMVVGELPVDHPAVLQLARRADLAARDGLSVTLLDVVALDRGLRSVDSSVRKKAIHSVKLCPTTGLTEEQHDLVSQYREELELYLAGFLILGSWYGLLQIAKRIPRALQRQLAERQAGKTPRAAREWFVIRHSRPIAVRVSIIGSTTRVATNEAAASMPLHEKLPDWLREQPAGEHRLAGVA